MSAVSTRVQYHFSMYEAMRIFRHSHLRICWLAASLVAVLALRGYAYGQATTAVQAGEEHSVRSVEGFVIAPVFERIMFDKGLSHGVVYCATQGRDGFMWFATEDGLNRFDGFSMKVYSPRAGAANALPHEMVRALCVDSSGTLWVGTHRGLCRYNPATDDFTPFLSLTETKNLEALNQQFRQQGATALNPTDGIIALCAASDGTLWIATERTGVLAYHPQTGAVRRYLSDESNPYTLCSNEIAAIAEDRNGDMWFGSQNRGLCRMQRATGLCERFLLGQSTAGAAANSLQAMSQTVLGIFTTPLTRYVWCGTVGQGLYRYDLETARWAHYAFVASDESSTVSLNSILSFSADLQAPQKRLWLGTRAGAVQFDMENDRFVLSSCYPSDQTSLSNDVVWSLCRDVSGNIWFGTDHGISQFSQYNQRFSTLQRFYAGGKPLSLSTSNVHAMSEDADGRLWIGTWGGGVNMFDPRSLSITTHSHNARDPRSLSHNNVWAVVHDKQRRVWAATVDGLNCLDSRAGGSWRGSWRGSWQRFYHNPANAQSPAQNYIKNLFVDRSGALWLAYTESGMSRVQLPSTPVTASALASAIASAAVWTHYRHSHTDASSLSANNVTAIIQTSNGALWAGTYGAGLNRFDSARGHWQRFIVPSPSPMSGVGAGVGVSENTRGGDRTGHTIITALHEDPAGTLWVGTMAGLYYFDERQQAFRHFRVAGLHLNERICAMVSAGKAASLDSSAGADGSDTTAFAPTLWLSTTKGIVKMSARLADSTQVLQRYELKSEIIHNRFNNRSAAVLRSGLLAFGGINGLSLFNPRSVVPNTHAPRVVITGIRHVPQSRLKDSNSAYLRLLELRPGDAHISFEFAALEFTYSAENRYAYMLEGFDEDWVASGSQRSATYTNLPAGRYTFRVRGSNNDGVWGETATALDVVVMPPWWRTWWMYGVYALLAALLLDATMRLRDKRQKTVFMLERQRNEAALIQKNNEELAAANAKLQELNNEKNEILSIAAHDMKNPISAVMMHAELLEENSHNISDEESAEGVRFGAKSIAALGQRMFDLVANLLDMNMIEQGKIDVHLKEFDVAQMLTMSTELYRSLAEAKSLHIDYLSSASEATEILAFADAAIVAQIIENLLSNAIKYSPLGRTITLRLVTDPVVIEQYQQRHGIVFANPPHDSQAALVPTGCLLVVVQDQGPGLSAKDKGLLFGKFSRLSAQPTAGENSSGLGLSIVKKLAEATGALVWCDSEHGAGATFVMQLTRA
jgi:signal transduction histidine kinase/ligand-binding sensor domain-containing protein